MSLPQASLPDADHFFLDGAYRRIQAITVAANSVAIVAALIFYGWRAALGGVIGAATAYLNLSWLHRGSETIIEGMLATPGRGPKRFRLFFHFIGRLAFVLAIGYVTFKSSLLVLYGFLLTLALPVVGLLGEAVYEAWIGRKINPHA